MIGSSTKELGVLCVCIRWDNVEGSALYMASKESSPAATLTLSSEVFSLAFES